MTSRVLPRSEWSRLNGTALETLWPKLDPYQASILVVEEDGVLLGAWAVLRMVHVEGLWMAPTHRASASVGRRLLTGMQRIARGWGAPFVWTGAETDTVRALIRKVGGYKIPYDSYVLPVGGRE